MARLMVYIENEKVIDRQKLSTKDARHEFEQAYKSYINTPDYTSSRKDDNYFCVNYGDAVKIEGILTEG